MKNQSIRYSFFILSLLLACSSKTEPTTTDCLSTLRNFHIEAMVNVLKYPNEKPKMTKDDLIMLIEKLPKNHIYYGDQSTKKNKNMLDLEFILDLREEEEENQNLLIFRPDRYDDIAEFVYKNLVKNLSKEVSDRLLKIGKNRMYHWKLSCKKDKICKDLKKKFNPSEISEICQRKKESNVLSFCPNICIQKSPRTF